MLCVCTVGMWVWCVMYCIYLNSLLYLFLIKEAPPTQQLNQTMCKCCLGVWTLMLLMDTFVMLHNLCYCINFNCLSKNPHGCSIWKFILGQKTWSIVSHHCQHPVLLPHQLKFHCFCYLCTYFDAKMAGNYFTVSLAPQRLWQNNL